MREYILLLPILFIIHDMEEIIGFERFYKKNGDLFEKFPKITMRFKGVKADAFALAVYEEFIPFFGVSLLAYYFPNKILYALWFGIFLSLTGHFIVHIGHTVYLRKYIPSFATSLICLPISVSILLRCAKVMTFDVLTIVTIIISILLMIANLRFAHAVAHFVNKQVTEQGIA